jgi:PHD/YefM family antitoxin component YafN of YafNO toxin-antitoxin module
MAGYSGTPLPQKLGIKPGLTVVTIMGGQACVFYGAAEFSRDADLVIVAQPENLERLRAALSELEALAFLCRS